MKKWMFVIFPGILLVIFLFFYQQTASEVRAKEKAAAEAADRAKAEDAARRADIELKAHQDADRRAAEAAAEEQQKEAEAKANRDKLLADIQSHTDANDAQIDRYSKDNAQLEMKIEQLHKQRDADSLSAFDLDKQVELARVDEHNAELEVQRMVDMIAKRAGESYLTRLPPAPAAPPPSQ
jgi:hypothetical protein